MAKTNIKKMGRAVLFLAFFFVIPSSAELLSSVNLPSEYQFSYARGNTTGLSSFGDGMDNFKKMDKSTGNFTFVCDPKRYSRIGLNVKEFGFCNKSLSYHVRAKDLIDRMVLQEKVRNIGNLAFGIERLGIPKYQWRSEALHGVSNKVRSDFIMTFFDEVIPGATSFPAPINLGASFNETLWSKIGEAISTEARAMYNVGRAGLTFLTPTINVIRDPRWGRIMESPSEDPYVVGTYAVKYVRGMQDVDEGGRNTEDLNSRPLKVSAMCKHLVAYDLEKSNGVDRYHFDAEVTEQDMVETFALPFEMCVKDGDVSSIMCSYNSVNGIPTCADPKLLSETVRGEWDFHGYIMADCDSVEEMAVSHRWLHATNETAVAQALRAGLDVDCAWRQLDFYTLYMENAVKQGKVREKDIDGALRNLYVVLMRLGYFDGLPALESLGKKDVCSEANIELASEAARQGIVLLKNDGTLPLSSHEIDKLAVVGPHANATTIMLANYPGIPCRFTSPIAGLAKFTNVNYEVGCLDAACLNQTHFSKALIAAEEADATVIVAGLDRTIEDEELDRENLLLPANQVQLINQVSEAAKLPITLVLMSAGGIDISFAKDNPKIGAILWAGYPGEEGGQAIAEVIYGKYNPGGRLPITWYTSDYVYKLPMTSMRMRPVDSQAYPGRTYKFYNGPTVYPFGYGLSYTNFSYKILKSSTKSLDIQLNKLQHCRQVNYKSDTAKNLKPSCQGMLVDDLKCDEKITLEVEIENKGDREGSEVVIVYSKPPEGLRGVHDRQVIGFKRVNVGRKQSKNVKFELNPCKSLGIVDYNAYRIIPAGVHTIMLGNGAATSQIQVNFFSHTSD